MNLKKSIGYKKTETLRLDKIRGLGGFEAKKSVIFLQKAYKGAVRDKSRAS